MEFKPLIISVTKWKVNLVKCDFLMKKTSKQTFKVVICALYKNNLGNLHPHLPFKLLQKYFLNLKMQNSNVYSCNLEKITINRAHTITNSTDFKSFVFSKSTEDESLCWVQKGSI